MFNDCFLSFKRVTLYKEKKKSAGKFAIFLIISYEIIDKPSYVNININSFLFLLTSKNHYLKELKGTKQKSLGIT